MLQDLEHASPSSVAVDSLDSTDTISPIDDKRSNQAYHDRRLSHESFPTSLPDASNLISPLPEAKVVSHSSHRRANTEIIPRESCLPSKQLFAEQSKTLEDISNKDNIAANTTKKKLGERARIFSDWFQGKSEPVNWNIVRQPLQDSSNIASTQGSNMEKRSSRELNPPVTLTRAEKRTTPPSPLKQVTTASRFSFFGLKRTDEPKQEIPEPADDEFLNLDITAALFPPGSSNLSDQEAFDALRKNADNLIRRLQAAYKQRTFALHEAMADKNEKQEELEETKTRVGHLKTQLDGVADKVLQQDKAMKAMADELEQEKQLRQRDDEAHRHSIMLVRSSEEETNDLGSDLRTPQMNLKRASNCTLDSGFESGDESVADSVFSRDGIGSPASTVTVPSPCPSQIMLSPPTSSPMMPLPKESKPDAAPPVRQSAYDRVVKGLASTGLANSLKGSSSKCTICYGVPASEAWTVLGVLKDENKGLKGRLGELETVIDDCLGLVGP